MTVILKFLKNTSV